MAKSLSLSEAVLLADKIETFHGAKSNCKVSRLVETLSDEDIALLKQLLLSDYQHSTVSRVLQSAGYDIHPQILSRHRPNASNKCTCGTFG